MRIMQIISGNLISGAMAHCALLSRELVRRGHTVTVVCRGDAWVGQQLAGAPIEVLHSNLKRFPPDELRRVAAEVRRRKIERRADPHEPRHFFGVLLRWFTGVPTVATAHSQHFQLHWMFNDLVIAVSDATRRYHHRFNLVPSNRIVTIHNFVVPADVPNRDAVRRETRASLGVADDELLMGVIGTVYRTKGHVYLIRALPQILAANGRARLAIVGDERSPRYARLLRNEARRLAVAERIVWTGQRSDIAGLTASLDLCVAPSLHETFSMVALEAMAAGIPVVASAVGGVREVVLPGETGLLVPSRDSNALAEAVIGLLADADRRRAFGAAGRARVLSHFSVDRQVGLLEAALTRAAACHPLTFARAA